MVYYHLLKTNELEQRVSEIKTEFPDHPIWKKIEDDPITLTTIDKLVGEGWKIEFSKSINLEYGLCINETKTIIIRENLSSYERDITILHEIVHAKYGKISQWHWIDPEEKTIIFEKITKLFFNGETVTELIARKLYKNQVLLNKAIDALITEDNLPMVPGQLTFKFLR